MRISHSVFLMIFLVPLSVLAQDPEPPSGPMRIRTGGISTGKQITIHEGMGKWWQDSEIAKKLQLSDDQVSKLNQIFFDHRMKLIDHGATMEKEDLKLQNLLDADDPNESQVSTQVDQVLTARSKLEREYTMMNLDLRKVLSVAQWRQLKSIREEHGPSGNLFFYKKMPPPGSDPIMIPAPPPPGPGGNDMF